MLHFVCMKIALITGGNTGEREVSLASARTIEQAISFATVELFVFPEQLQDFLSVYQEYCLAIPMIHGKGGEDGALQGLLELLTVPHLFGGVRAHAIGIDKQLCKNMVSALGIQVPLSFHHPGIDQGSSKVSYPVFIKSNTGGSSLQMGLCENEEDLDVCLSSGIQDPIIEQAISGREFTVGVIEKEGALTALPVTEIIPRAHYFDYESKYDVNELAEEVCPALIDDALACELQSAAVRIHKELGVQYLSRSDFIVTTDGEVYFLEINTIPGMTPTSLVPRALKASGVDLSSLLKYWCNKLTTNK